MILTLMWWLIALQLNVCVANLMLFCFEVYSSPLFCGNILGFLAWKKTNKQMDIECLGCLYFRMIYVKCYLPNANCGDTWQDTSMACPQQHVKYTFMTKIGPH